MNSKEELNWFAILFGVPLIVFLLMMIPATDVLAQQLFTALDSTTATFFTNLVKIGIAGFVFFLVLGVVWTVISSLKGSPTQY
jgi:hypothetical protein